MMIIGSSLPNDLLRNLPPGWQKTIATWPINDALLTAISEAERLLDELGYYLKFGIEVNLDVLSVSEANEFTRNTGRRLMAWRQAAREQFLQSLSSARNNPLSLDAYAELYSQLEQVVKQRLTTPGPHTEELLGDWGLLQSFYQRARWQNEAAETILARKDFIIAALHLLPQHMGGLEGIIEHRFASKRYGEGWWDADNEAELRTYPVRGHENAIANYHHVLWRFKQALEYGGLVPAVYGGLAQAHFSLWRKKDNVNILALKDDESLGLQARFAGSIRDLLITQPLEYPSIGLEERELIEEGVPFVGSSRMSVIRVCKGGHWELRLPHNRYGLTHLARDLYLLTEAARIFMQPESPSARSIREQLAAAQKDIDEHAPGAAIIVDMKNLIDPHSSHMRPIRQVRKIEITATPPRKSCPFVSCLEAAIIDEQGKIDVPPANFLWNGHLMLQEVGPDPTKIFGVEDKREIRSDAWHELFKKLVIAEDGRIDASALHPDIARHFNGLTVSGYYKDIHGGELTGGQVGSRSHVNAVMASWMAAGKYHPVSGENMTPAQREIFGFLKDRRFTFDSEEAQPYLLHLYNRSATYAADSEAIAQKTIELAVGVMFQDAMGQWLRKKGAYPQMLASEVDYIQEHEVLRLMLSLHESVLAALPEVAKFDPPRTEQFCAHIGELLRHPETLYGPEFIGGVLSRVSLDSSGFLETMQAARAISAVDKQEYIKDIGRRLGRMTVRLAAAAQPDSTQAINILSQYAGHAESLTRPPGRHEGPRMPSMLALEGGMQQGVVTEAQKLLENLSPISGIRQRALEGLNA